MKNNILAAWNIHNEKVKQIYPSAWTIGEKYILKTSNEIDWLKRNLNFIRVLSKYNVPVPTIVKTIDGAEYVVDGTSYYFLSKKIKGQHITDIFSNDYRKLAYHIGTIIAKLHIAFQSCENEVTCSDHNFYNEMTGWVMETYRNKKITIIPDEIIQETMAELKYSYPKLERQLIHRDIHLGNMLFENDELTGYIDFDLSRNDARIFDLCYMALSFLIDHVNDDDKTEKWLEILQQLIEGYNSLLTLTDVEKSSIWNMMIAIEILFVAYFTNQNDQKCANGASEMIKWLWINKIFQSII